MGQEEWLGSRQSKKRLQLPPAGNLETGNAEVVQALARGPGHYPSTRETLECGPSVKGSVTLFSHSGFQKSFLQQPGRKIQSQKR